MKVSSRRRIVLVLSLITLFVVAGCAKKTKPEEETVANAANAEMNPGGDSDSGNAMGLQTVHFPYDSFVLTKDAKRVLNSNAKILKDNSGVKVQIEGHCDQRGGIQYNIALGEKRANVAKKFLEDLGLSSDRITVISFGKERPVDPGTTEEAYAKNRRDNFVITSR